MPKRANFTFYHRFSKVEKRSSPTMTYTLPAEMTKISVGQDVEKMEPLYIDNGFVKYWVWKQFESSSK